MRRHVRKPFDAAVLTSSPAWNRPLFLQAVNLSHGGIFLACESPIEIGTELWLEIPLGQQATFGVHGTVVHLVSAQRAALDGHAPGAGIRFEPLDAARDAQLGELLETLPPPQIPIGDPSPTDESDRAALEAELGRLRELRPWQILEISRDATPEQADTAFQRLAKRYHPDVLAARLPIELRSLAVDCYLAVRRAYEQFIHPRVPIAEPVPVAADRRQTTSRGVAVRAGSSAPGRAARSFSVPASLTPRTAAVAPAVPISNESVPACDAAAPGPARPAERLTECALEAYQREDYAEARTKLAAALRAQPRNRTLLAAYYVALGFELLARNRPEEGAASFQRALLCDGHNQRAVAALREIAATRMAARRRTLAKLMG